MKELMHEDPRIMAAAERQMRAWSLAQEIAASSSCTRRVDRPHGQFGDFITLSREAGAGGGEIGEAVGRRLGWEVLDKGLLDRVAQGARLPRAMLDLVDETQSNWAYDVFGSWLDRRIVPHEKYMVHAARAVLAAARRGNVVLVGRGCQFLLPPGHGLAVRVIASEKYRVRRVMEKFNLSESQARQFIATLDRGRKEFVSRFFHRDVTDPHWYDLVINVEFLGPDAAVELIVAAWRQIEARRRGEAVPRPSPGTVSPR